MSTTVDGLPIPHAPPRAPKRTIEITIDGKSVQVSEGATILDACRKAAIETPTLCYLENLTPVNACRHVRAKRSRA